MLKLVIKTTESEQTHRKVQMFAIQLGFLQLNSGAFAAVNKQFQSREFLLRPIIAQLSVLHLRS